MSIDGTCSIVITTIVFVDFRLRTRCLSLLKETEPLQRVQLGKVPLQHAIASALNVVDWHDIPRTAVAVALIQLHDWIAWSPVEATGMLEEDELQRANRQRIPGNRDALVLTYALRRAWLARVLGIGAAEVEIGRDGLGCPVLGDRRFRTSLSHCEGFAAFAVTMRGPVGVDIEPSTRASVLPEIAGLVYAPSEHASIPPVDAAGYGLALLDVWVRKEALLKAAGVGLDREMNAFPAPLDSPVELPGNGPGIPMQLSMVDAGSAARVAIARPCKVPVAAYWLRPGMVEPGKEASTTEAATGVGL